MKGLTARRSAFVLAFLASLTLGATPAYADDPRADSRAAFLRGVNEAHQEHFTAARDAFLEAYRLYPHPSILLNLGIARMRTGEYVVAEENLNRFLTDSGGAPPEDLADARAALQVVRQHIGTLRLRVSPTAAQATLDGAPLTLTASTFVDVRATIGPGDLRVEAPGYLPVTRQVMIARDAVAPVDVVLDPDPNAPKVKDGKITASRAASNNTTLGWGLVGAAAVLAVVGGVSGVEAIVHAHDYNTLGSSDFQNASTRSTGVTWRTSSDVLFTTAIVAGGVGAYFLLAPIKGGGSVHAVITPSFSGAVVRF